MAKTQKNPQVDTTRHPYEILRTLFSRLSRTQTFVAVLILGITGLLAAGFAYVAVNQPSPLTDVAPTTPTSNKETRSNTNPPSNDERSKAVPEKAKSSTVSRPHPTTPTLSGTVTVTGDNNKVVNSSVVSGQ